MRASSPIGIFDSGIGGLTVANAIRKILPNENLIYFGDTAHLPYGDKSSQAICRYSKKISTFLLAKKCKMIVIACNTASSLAYETVKNFVGGQTLVVNVISPVTQYVAKSYNKGKIGVIGTKGTIRSRIYVRKIFKKNNQLKVTSLATPLLAPMIEEGFYNNYISRTIIHSYLSKHPLKKINAIILACTHYPLIKKEVEEFYKGKVEIIDSAEIVALFVKVQLSKNNLLNNAATKPKYRFFVSDYTEAFEKSAKMFFKEEIRLKKVNP